MIDDCLKSDRNPHQKNAYKLEYTPRPYTVRIKKKVIELCSALARSLYNLQKSFFRRRKDQAFSFRLLSFL